MNLNNIKEVRIENTVTRNDPIIEKWTKNYLANLNSKIFVSENSRPFSFLQRTMPYRNKPFVLVVGGPSLDKNVNILKKYEKNVIILSCDVTLYKLLEYDIKPDFVVNIDPSDMFVRFWNDLETSEINLICPTSAHPDILDCWKGKIFFFNQADVPNSSKGNALKKLTKSTGAFGTIFNRFFIGATMLQVVSHFNPSKVILMGYDFAYTDGKAYCDGFLDRKIYDDTLEPGSPEQIEHIEKLKAMEIKSDSEIKDVNRNLVKTSKTFIFYRNSFLDLIKKLKVDAVNSTEGGILTGMPNMKLKDSLYHYCKDKIDKIDVFAMPKSKRRKRRKKR